VLRKFKKHKLIGLVLCVAVFVMAAGVFCRVMVWNANKIVSDVQMEAYGKTFLRKYEDLVQSKVLPAYHKYFSFLKDKPFLIKATISNSHGAAIEFIPSEKQIFQSRNVEGQIEQEIFSDKDPTILRAKIESYDHNEVATINYIGTGSYFKLGKNSTVRNLAVNTPNGSFLELLEISSILTQGVLVNGIFYPNTINVKGSNRKDAWSRKVAKEDALYYFKLDSRDAYLNSEEFREFVANPELTRIANEIDAKYKSGKYGGEYGNLEFKEDMAELIAVTDAHGIKHEFAKNIYEFVKEQPSWRERHWIICALMITFLGLILIWFFKWGRKWIWIKIKCVWS